MTPGEQLSSALQKVYANPGILRKDGSIAPGAYAKPVDGFDPQPRARQETPPKGTIDVGELARANQKIRVIGEHLKDAIRAAPASREIGDAGMTWASLDGQIGLGLDARFVAGGFSVPVTPNNEALAESWAHSGTDKMAGGFFDLRKALTKARAQPMTISRVAGEIVSRSAFSKSKDVPVSSDNVEAQQLLRRHSLETGLAHMKILSDRIKAAMTAVGSNSMASPHLSAAHLAATEARAHMERCLKNEDER